MKILAWPTQSNCQLLKVPEKVPNCCISSTSQKDSSISLQGYFKTSENSTFLIFVHWLCANFNSSCASHHITFFSSSEFQLFLNHITLLHQWQYKFFMLLKKHFEKTQQYYCLANISKVFCFSASTPCAFEVSILKSTVKYNWTNRIWTTRYNSVLQFLSWVKKQNSQKENHWESLWSFFSFACFCITGFTDLSTNWLYK